MVLAKRRPAMTGFSQQLSARQVRKRYLALVRGKLPRAKDTIRTPLVDLHGAFGAPQEASTRYEVLSSSASATLVACFPETGRLHQIRRHFHGLRHALAGDGKYPDEPFNRLSRESWGLNRLFLHASSIAFAHPQDGRRLVIEAPLPGELAAVVAAAGLTLPTA